VVMGTRLGVVKKTDLAAFSNPRQAGIIAMGIEEGDAVIDVQLSNGQDEILLATREGMAIRFSEEEVRPMGRTAYGVRGIALREGDQVVSMAVIHAQDGYALCVTANGYGKRTELSEYRVQSRGGVGIINIQTSDRNGPVVGALFVSEDDQLMLMTQQGKILRTRVTDTRPIGRNTQGVRLIRIDEADRVVSVARFAEKDDGSGTPAEAEKESTPASDTDTSTD
jgi:DNA gyrase subunit A